MAERAGVSPAVLRAVLADDPEAMPADVALVWKFTRATLAHDAAVGLGSATHRDLRLEGLTLPEAMRTRSFMPLKRNAVPVTPAAHSGSYVSTPEVLPSVAVWPRPVASASSWPLPSSMR